MKFLSQINVNTRYTLPMVDGTNGQVLSTDGNGVAYWGTISAGSFTLDGLSDVIITSPSSDQMLRYGLRQGDTVPVWHNFTPNFLTPSSSIDALSDVTITTAALGQILQYNGSAWVNATLSTVEYVSKVQHTVKAGVAITKGQAVYITGSDGTNMIAGLASNTSEGASSKVMGLAASTAAINGQIFVVTEGLLAGLNTSTATAGDPVWLGTSGNLIFGLANKPTSPAHLVYLGVVTRVQQNNGEIFVKVQNGIEIDEIHDVQISSPATGQLLRRDSDGYWKNWTPNFLTDEADTLATVTARGATTTNAITVGGLIVDTNTLVVDAANDRVGIGTASPSYKLDINGVTRFQDIVRFKTDAWNLSDDGKNRLYFGNNDRTYFGSFNGYEWRNASDVALAVITNAGNVGIGTTSPAQKLQVDGNVYVNDDSTTGNGIMLRGADRPLIARGWDPFTSGNKLGVGRWGVYMESAELFIGAPGTDYSNALITLGGWLVNGTREPNLTINNSTQRVGIGTTSPGQKLTVAGNISLTGTSAVFLDGTSGWGAPMLGRDGTNIFLSDFSGVQLGGWNGSSYGARMTVQGTGNVGIGTTAPGALLQVGLSNTTSDALLRLGVTYDNSRSSRGGITWHDAANTTGKIYTEYDGSMVSMVFGSLYNSGYNSNQLMIIRGNGNVGIGTTSPNAKLDVNGAANAISFSSTALLITNADTSGSLQPGQGDPANKIYSFRWQGNEGGYIDTDNKITFSGFKTPAGTSSQFLKANGTVDSNTYITSTALNGYATQAWVNTNYYNRDQIDDFFGGAEAISGYNKSNWDAAYNDKINSASFSTTTGVLTLTQQDTGTVTVDLDGRYLESLPAHNHDDRYYTETESDSRYINASGDTMSGSLSFDAAAVIKKKITGVGDNPVKTASGVLASRSDNGGGYTYYVIETNVPQDDYQMGGFTIELFGRYGETNNKTKIDLGGYWNPEENGGFIGFEAHGTNPQYKPTIEVSRNSEGKTAFIIYGVSWFYPVIVARDLWLGYSQTDGSTYGEGWIIRGTNDVSSYTNKDTVVWRNGYSDSNPAGYITGYSETDTLASVTARGASTSTNSVFTGGLQARKNQTNNNYTTAALWTESYGNTTTGIAFHISGNVGKFLEMRTDGILYWEDRQVWTSGNLTNLNQLSNGPGYITGYTETDTLATVVARGNSTSSHISVDYIITTNNGNGTNVRLGDDFWMGDVNLANTARFMGNQNNANAYIIFGNGDATALGRAGTGALTYGGNVIWHAGNDGDGSGLDADSVDGVHASNIVWGNARGTNDSLTTDADGLDKTGFYTSSGFVTRPEGVDNWMYIQHIKLYNSNSHYQKQIGYDTYDDRMWVRTKSGNTWSSWKAILTSENIGSYALTSLPAHNHDDRYYTETESDSRYVNTSGDTMTGNITLKYSGADTDDYSALTFSAGGDDYIIKASSSRGVFGRSSYGWHVNSSSAFGVYSSGWVKLFGVEGNTGNTQVFGSLTVNGSITESSSIRYKKDIVDIEHLSSKIELLRPVRYKKIENEVEEIGLIAEDVAELFPEVVKYDNEGRPDGVNYSRLSIILLKAVQELTERVNKLENK